MDEFNNENLQNENEENSVTVEEIFADNSKTENEAVITEEKNEELFEQEEVQNDINQTEENFVSDFDDKEIVVPIVAEPVTEYGDNKFGIKIFSLILAAVLILCVIFTGGYYLGRNHQKASSGFNNSLLLQSKPDESSALTSEQVYTAANPSVVGIVIYSKSGIKGYASGVVYSEDGYIITNDHIYADVPNAMFKVYTYDGNVYSAAYVAGDTRSDLAVLKINSSGFFPAKFGNSDELICGERVYAIGRPNDATADSSITTGIISFLNRRVSNSTNYSSKLIQTDSAINPGSSGGALVNRFGQVIGITSSKLVGSAYEGVGYSIPTTTVKKVVESLIANGKVTDRARMGITYSDIDEITAEFSDYPSAGLYIASVSEESGFYGKIAVGEMIIEVNGNKIKSDDIMLDTIESAKPGDEITLTVIAKTGATRTVSGRLIADIGSSSYVTEDINVKPLPDNDDNNSLPSDEFNDLPFPY